MEYISIGKVTTTHGIKGEIKLMPINNDMSKFKDLEYLYLGDKKEKLTIEKARPHKNIIIIKFKEFNNINEVLLYKDQKVYISKEDRAELSDDEFYIADLIGVKVYNTNDDYIGNIDDVLQGIGNDVYVVVDEKKEYLIPAVKEFIVNIDIDKKKMIIDPIDGMIE